jgi:hypothetical protein
VTEPLVQLSSYTGIESVSLNGRSVSFIHHSCIFVCLRSLSSVHPLAPVLQGCTSCALWYYTVSHLLYSRAQRIPHRVRSNPFIPMPVLYQVRILTSSEFFVPSFSRISYVYRLWGSRSSVLHLLYSRALEVGFGMRSG